MRQPGLKPGQKTEGIMKAIIATILGMLFLAGCGHNPTGPSDQPTAEPSVQATATQISTPAPTAVPTQATPITTPTPVSTATSAPTIEPTPTATATPATKRLKYVLTSGCHADVFLYLPGVGAPVTVWPGSQSTYTMTVAADFVIPDPQWVFYAPQSPFTYTTIIYVDSVVYSEATKTY